MSSRLISACIFAFLQLILLIPQAKAENCSSDWVSPNPDQLYTGAAIWQQTLPPGCYAGCVKITVVLKVERYNDRGTLDLYCSNTEEIQYGDPDAVFSSPKLGWIGRINVPISLASPGWKTITFNFRLPHLEWLNDNGSIYLALEGQRYSIYEAQFRVASAKIETIAWSTDLDGDGDIDGRDLANFIANFGCSGNCAADFNGDGVVDGDDIPSFSDEHGWTGCPLGFYESYHDGLANGWVADNTNVWTVGGDVYKMTGLQPSPARLRWSYKNQVFDDFSFEGTIKQIEGIQTNASGLLFKSSSGLSSRYEFLITSSGAYTVNKYVGGVLTQLIPWTSSSRIYKGYDKSNLLRVTCAGPSMQFFINGGLVNTLTEAGISSGRAGFVALDTDTDVNVFQFDDALLEKN
jgi:hypothetical protein